MIPGSVSGGTDAYHRYFADDDKAKTRAIMERLSSVTPEALQDRLEDRGTRHRIKRRRMVDARVLIVRELSYYRIYNRLLLPTTTTITATGTRTTTIATATGADNERLSQREILGVQLLLNESAHFESCLKSL